MKTSSIDADSPLSTTDPTYLAGTPAALHIDIKTKVYSEQEPLPLSNTVGAVFQPPERS